MQKRTKQKILIALTALIGALLIVYSLYYFNRNFGFRSYTDKKAGFSLQYPGDWAYAVNKDGANVIFYSPHESELDLFTENVNVVVTDISRQPMHLIEFTNLALKQMDIVFQGQIDIVESEPYALGTYKGYKYTVVGTGDNSVKFLMIWTLKGNFVYQFTFAALDSAYEHYFDKVDKMVKSFRIIR